MLAILSIAARILITVVHLQAKIRVTHSCGTSDEMQQPTVRMLLQTAPRNSSPVSTSTNGVSMLMKAEQMLRPAKVTCLRSLYCWKCVSQTWIFNDVARLAQHSHVPWPFSRGKQMRPEDTTALTDGHIERSTRGTFSFGTQVVSV